MRLDRRAEKGVRTVSMLVTVFTLIWLTDFFSESLMSCLLLVWKHTAERVDVPVLGSEDAEIGLIAWGSLGIAIMTVCGMRKRLKAVFRGKPGKWYAVLALPLLVVAIVTYAANWGASYGILYRSGGNLGLYFDQIFSYVGWGVLSGLSLFAVGLYVFGMDRIYVEQKKAEQYHAQIAFYQMQEEQYRQSERLRHDLKNHVLALSGLWEDREWERLGNYLKSMENSAELGAYEEATGSRVVDGLLYQKRKMAQKKQISWEESVKIPKSCNIDEFDLCVLFGNLLDNAVEACEKSEHGKKRRDSKPFIRVHAGAAKKCLLMEVANSTAAAERSESGYTEKINLPEYGIGLLNVEDVVRRYNGAMNIEINSGVFVISVLLPLSDAAHDVERAV